MQWTEVKMETWLPVLQDRIHDPQILSGGPLSQRRGQALLNMRQRSSSSQQLPFV
jgi:hypothetical protein